MRMSPENSSIASFVSYANSIGAIVVGNAPLKVYDLIVAPFLSSWSINAST